MTDEAVRPAVEDDVDALDWLQALARAGAADVRGGSRWLEESPAITDWPAMLLRSDAFVAVGTVNDVVLGILVATTVELRLEVHGTFVHEQARELGLGDGLLELSMSWGRARGCTLVEGVALPGDRQTKNLFERAGITARKITVSRQL